MNIKGIYVIFLPVLLLAGNCRQASDCVRKKTAGLERVVIRETRDTLFDKAVECVKRFEGWHSARHHPFIGYGHRLLPGERLTAEITVQQADSLLRADLLGLCAVFRRFGQDSLLLAVLGYHVGAYRLLGYDSIPKSRLIRKLESGDRDIYTEYVSFRRYKGAIIPSIERRRKEEFRLLYLP